MINPDSGCFNFSVTRSHACARPSHLPHFKRKQPVQRAMSALQIVGKVLYSTVSCTIGWPDTMTHLSKVAGDIVGIIWRYGRMNVSQEIKSQSPSGPEPPPPRSGHCATRLPPRFHPLEVLIFGG